MALIDDILPSLNILIQGLAKHFGNTSEFVVHDFKDGRQFDHTIASIINGHVTGRTIGDSILQVEMNPLSEAKISSKAQDGVFNYFTRTQDGRTLKSSMIYLRDQDNIIVGAICINSDVTQLQQAKNYIDHYVGIPSVALPENSPASCIDEFLVTLIYESIDAVGVPITSMSREQKMTGIKFLKDRGAFKITKASEIIAKFYDISKYTVYNYLNESCESQSMQQE
ncbi:MAG: helix-turn-helix transcriptional regulator [Oscillospiraceae bacterium]|nr:helix-turn-helix transcriptional regulator [Oscillospiraceae bacterium]